MSSAEVAKVTNVCPAVDDIALLKGMMTSPKLIAEGDTVVVYISYGSMHMITVKRGHTLAMKYGALRHEFLIGKEYGSEVQATAGFVHVLRATPELWTQSMPHRTQIIYTHDIGTITHQLELQPGMRVCESGTGSGSMTHALLRCIAPHGHVYTYDIDASRVDAIRHDAQVHGFGECVTAELRNVCNQGFGEHVDNTIDAIFLDLPSPWECMPAVLKALNNTKMCRVATFSPCIEQVSRTVAAMRESRFINIETVEVVPQTFKPETVELINPFTDEVTAKHDLTMQAPDTQPTHTSYLTFATVLRRA